MQAWSCQSDSIYSPICLNCTGVPPSCLACLPCRGGRAAPQVENAKLTDYEGTYARFLEKNEQEAAVMAAKDQKKKELDKSQIKSKSKVDTFMNCSRWQTPRTRMSCHTNPLQ